MSRTCLCCGKPLARQTCGYCGFVDVEILTTDAESFLAEEIAQYAGSIAADITNISVTSAVYEWNAANSRLEMTTQKVETKIADGADCYRVRSWSDQGFGQLSDGKDITLDLSYQFRGSKKQLSCTVPTVRCDDFWRVGVMIDNALQLRVFLGTKKQYTESGSYDLVLK